MSQPTYTIAELVAQEGKFEELKLILTELAKETRKEPGALEYFFIEDKLKPNTILSCERWENEAEEAKHWETEHLKNGLARASKVIVNGEAILHKGPQII